MSCFNYINSTNYSISFCEGYRICLVSTTLTPSTTECHVVKFNCINYIDSLNYTISFMSCLNYINSISYIFSFYKDYRICLISITLTPSTTWKSIMLTTSIAWNTTNWMHTEYILFQLHKLFDYIISLTPSTTQFHFVRFTEYILFRLHQLHKLLNFMLWSLTASTT